MEGRIDAGGGRKFRERRPLSSPSRRLPQTSHLCHHHNVVETRSCAPNNFPRHVSTLDAGGHFLLKDRPAGPISLERPALRRAF
jgi:hypothetical protein